MLVLPLLLVAPCVHAVSGAALRAAATSARGGQPNFQGAYYWPSGRGRPGQYSATPFLGPTNFSTDLAWRWRLPEDTDDSVIHGAAVDGERNSYITTDTAVYKLQNLTSQVMWRFAPGATIPSTASLLAGNVHFTTSDGRLWAVAMDTGRETWSTKVCDHISTANGFVSASEGVVVAATDAVSEDPRGGNGVVRAVSAADGSPLWSSAADAPISNFLASFPGDGSLVYQDCEGRVYRRDAARGGLLWKAGGDGASWTGSAATVANDGTTSVVLAVSAPSASVGGSVSSYRLGDGQLLWRRDLPERVSNVPAVGWLAGHNGPSVVLPGGSHVYALGAKTGEDQWSFEGPDPAVGARSSRVSFVARSTPLSPPPWGMPTVDARGALYIGHKSGALFLMGDWNGDGVVRAEEVSAFDTEASFEGSSGPAHSPGGMGIASCDSFFAFLCKGYR